MREMPAHDLPRAAVDHAHQIGPAHGRTRPDLRHVRLPDLISAHWLPRDPTLFSVVRADDASAPATHVLASPVTLACDSPVVLSSAAATTPLADSRRPASLRRPSRSPHRKCGPLGCLAAAFASTDSTG